MSVGTQQFISLPEKTQELKKGTCTHTHTLALKLLSPSSRALEFPDFHHLKNDYLKMFFEEQQQQRKQKDF